jgi:excisionase family DNA binding protein
VKKKHSAAKQSALLTVSEAVVELNVGRTKVYDLILSGQLESIKIGSLRRIPRASIDRFVNSALARGDR